MFTWALVGSPNAGKTTLYNWLTGARAKVVNYPGATVEYSVGPLQPQLSEKFGQLEAQIIDTPGVYSLNPQSDDEKVTYETLFKSRTQKTIDGVMVITDGFQLNRHLVLAEQIKESGYPVILVIAMKDLLDREGTRLDIDLLKNELGMPVVQFDGILGHGLDHILLLMKNFQPSTKNIQSPQWSLQLQENKLKWSEQLAKKATIQEKKPNHSAIKMTHFFDEYLLHPFFGYIIFFILMTGLFASIFWMASPFMDIIDSLFGFLTEKITESIPSLAGNFLGEGLVAAIGGVVIFVPQIFILSFGIGLLESTGYLARVGALIDKPLTAVGLGGRSFVPLLSGFACAIPAVMATRNITSRKERLIAQMIIPFMACSARLPVYALIISFLMGENHPLLAGLVMTLLYFGAILVGAIAAKILSKIIKGENQSRLLMELPLYRRPRFRVLFLQAFNKSKVFIFRAGPIIMVLALVLWFGTNFPRNTEITSAQTEISEQSIAQQSYAAQVGKKIEPLFKPLGVDWRVGFGLISAFAAREVFVSAMALSFNIQGEEDTQTEGLLAAMREATFPDGRPIFTIATSVGILIFFMIALQCISTVAIVKRETGSWKIATAQLVASNLLAYGLAVIVVHSLKAFGL